MLVMWATAVPQGVQRYDVMNGISIATSLVSTGAGLAVVYAGYGVVGFVFARILTTALAGVIGFVAAHRLLPTLRLHFGLDREMLRRIWGISVYGAVIRILGMFTGSIDRTLIGIWLGTAAVAAYSVPYTVTIYLGQLMLRTMHFIFPMASELFHSGHLEYLRDIFSRSSRFVVAVSSIVVLPLAVLADSVLTLWVGPELAMASAHAFRLLLIGTYLSSMVALFSHILVGIGYVKQFTWMYVLKTCFLFGACLLLIRPLGILGAGIAILATSMLDIVFGAFCLRMYIGIPATRFFGAYILPVGLGIGLSCLVYLVRPYVSSWFVLGGVMFGYAVLYLFAGFYIGVFGRIEKDLLLRIPIALFRRAGASASKQG
jgi:O-antigen/teichoic acid export membrane protein